MTPLDDFMARGARRRGVKLRPSRFRGRGHGVALSDARIDLRGPGFDWILIRVRTAADVERALELLRHAMHAARTIAP